ncbi:SpoIIE family protein phosphatase [Actinokineospora diospyrosa]|uniref:histidine kinase n=1 Tax=Actinokineospora diospyrosa TaxID=103728 RepID=A0ABT1IA20_9PSEU|nr:SpoIIE family protein phosphatase [Actinokineospora diospyrosa]MCP2269471.1 PAS/PAC sensor hybrid histidine kinase [Actinokineospora diospyrosa]
MGGVDVFSADREVGRDLEAVDWAGTPLGVVEGWPQSLRTAVSIVLSSRFPMWLAWGPELTFFCNSSYRRDTLGRKYPWALGRPASEVWAEIWDDIGPRIEAVLTTGTATWDEALLLVLERSGFPEETYHTFSYSPLRDDADAVVGMLCVVSEDTDRVIGERRMATLRDLGSNPSAVRTEQETLAFARDQLERNPHDLPFTLTYVFDDDGTAHLAGTTGIAVEHAAAPNTLPPDNPVWPAAALAAGESVLVELDAEVFAGLPSGRWSAPPAQAVVVPLKQQGAAPYGFMVVGLNRYRPLDEGYRGFVDLVATHVAAGISSARGYQAQQRRAEGLAELDRAKTAFFSNVSHEFRTPLTLIMGPLDDLRDRLGHSDGRVREEIEVIHRNALRLGKLVNTLLDFSRIEAGRMQAHYEPVDLAATTAELASVFRSAIDRAGLDFVVDCPPLSEPVYVDLGMWEKVVLNLLSNAVKFTFDGSVGISVRAEDKTAVVVIHDTGIGIPPEEIPRLFERFHRIENARSRSNEGSGIGLALVQELVGLHGGAITADSTVGEGTSFTIRLPFGSAHLPADALSSGQGSSAVSATAQPYVQEALRWLPGAAPVVAAVSDAHATVVVADDNADMREYLVRLLSEAGYQVRAVTDGVLALEEVRTSPPDLLVSDVMMPRMDGLALLTALRGDPRTAAVPVLLLSARAGQEASIEGLRAGADDYLVKPFAAAELLARVRATVELARMRTHHARWRTAMVDSLQEAFFVCDDEGAVVEINNAFADILGYGPEGLPYAPRHAWWPDETADPEAYRTVVEVVTSMRDEDRGSYHAIPVVHRDGHRLWISASLSRVQDPDTGRTVTVGTFRDVTAAHHAIQRDTALAALNMRLTNATSSTEALMGALSELRDLWRAERVLALVRSDEPRLTSTDPDLTWEGLPEQRRDALIKLCGSHTLAPVTDGATGVAVTLDHPDGPMVLWLDLSERRPFGDQDELLLSLLAGHLAQGLARAHQIDQQRETALALQRAILGPAVLPAGFVVRYEPAASPVGVGGDWYDTVPLPDGRIGIVVGDCVGRGLNAAVVMGQLRSACRALLLQDVGPARTLMAMDHFAAGVPGAVCTTVFCGVLDPSTGVLTYSSAGHPPAILTHPDGTAHHLDQAASTPLAVQPGVSRPEVDRVLPVRATLLIYTDGLVERRRRSLTEGIDQVITALRVGGDSTLDALADQVMTHLAPDTGYDDDVAVLLYRHPAPLELTFPADAGQLAPARRTLGTWLERYGVPAPTTQDILVAVGEACANAIEHGYHDTEPASVHLRAEATVHDLHLTITDTGHWRQPDPARNPHRGRGIALMRAFMHHVAITHTPTGTTVEMRTRVFP